MAKGWMERIRQGYAKGQDWVHRFRKVLEDELHFSSTHRFLHFWVLVGKSFVNNRCPVRAGALAFSAVLALIPLLAVTISVSTGILQNQGKEAIQDFTESLIRTVAPQLELVPQNGENGETGEEQVLDRITDFVENVQSGTLGVSGIIALILVAISMINTIESTFNDIWGIPRGRSWMTRVVHYWSVLTLGPILLVTLVGLTTVPYVSTLQNQLMEMPIVGKWVVPTFRFLLVTLVFVLIYLFMPNTQVQWQAALAGALVGGGLWQIYNSSNALFVSKVTRDASIYGNFAVVPIFVIGLYFSWIILLFGAQVTYAYQNRHHYLQGKRTEAMTERGREFAAFRILTFLGIRFESGEPAPSIPIICKDLNLPDQLVRQLCQKLNQANIVQEVIHETQGYCPGRPLEKISAASIFEAVRGSISHEQWEEDDPMTTGVREAFERIANAESKTAEEITLADLVRNTERGNAEMAK